MEDKFFSWYLHISMLMFSEDNDGNDKAWFFIIENYCNHSYFTATINTTTITINFITDIDTPYPTFITTTTKSNNDDDYNGDSDGKDVLITILWYENEKDVSIITIIITIVFTMDIITFYFYHHYYFCHYYYSEDWNYLQTAVIITTINVSNNSSFK